MFHIDIPLWFQSHPKEKSEKDGSVRASSSAAAVEMTAVGASKDVARRGTYNRAFQIRR